MWIVGVRRIENKWCKLSVVRRSRSLGECNHLPCVIAEPRQQAFHKRRRFLQSVCNHCAPLQGVAAQPRARCLISQLQTPTAKRPIGCATFVGDERSGAHRNQGTFSVFQRADCGRQLVIAYAT